MSAGPQISKEDAYARMETVCNMVADGKTLRQIAAHFGVVEAGTILKWVRAYPEHVQMYSLARDAAGDLFEAEIIDAAMLCSPDTAASDRVKISALQWVAARRSPRKYGDRMQTEHSGSVNFGELTEDDIDRRIAILIKG
jgi:hypothetical protein